MNNTTKEPTNDVVEMTCRNCKNFRLHYIKRARGSYAALHYGHCVKPRLKKRYIDDKACTHWQKKNDI